jgi:hypothetical protein
MKQMIDTNNELITEEWLHTTGFDNCKPCHVWGIPNMTWYNAALDIQIYNHNDTGEWLWVEFDSVPMRTRRDLLLLIEWAGLRVR